MSDSLEIKMRQVTDSFVERLRQGESPSIEDYKSRFPELADEIDDVFPALEMLEQCRPDREEETPKLAAVQDATPDRVGEYVIVQELGRGGMGVVYEAEHETMCRRVALKILPRSMAANFAHMSRFHREARAAGQLHHSNIVPVFEVGRHDGLHFYAMQFIRGQNLDLVIDEVRRLRSGGSSANGAGVVAARKSLTKGDLSRTIAMDLVRNPIESGKSGPTADESGSIELSSGSPLEQSADRSSQFSGSRNGSGRNDTASVVSATDWSTTIHSRQQYFYRVAELVRQVANALGYAHRNGVLHRDVKPSNLILDTVGVVWVTDFGLAKTEDENLTHTGDVVGTLRYMAPERFDGNADARSDVYSLGLTLYELCTLRHAYDQADRARLVEQVTRRSPTRPRQIDVSIPRDLETIILKAIERDPEKRYQTAQQLENDLELFVHDRPIKARRISSFERFWRVCRRNPVMTGMAAMIVALLIFVAAGSTWFAIRNQRLAGDLLDESGRSRRAETQALAAYQESKQSLFRAYLEQARARRLTQEPDRQAKAITSISAARELLHELDLTPEQIEEELLVLRNEAVAALALPSLVEERSWSVQEAWTRVAAFDRSFDRYAQTDLEGNIRIRSVEAGEDFVVLAGPGERAWEIQFSPDGRYLAAKYHAFGAKSDPDVLVWDLENPEAPVVKATEGQSMFLSFDFNHDGSRFALASSNDGVNIHQLPSGELIQNIPAEFPFSAKIRFAADGRIAVGHYYNSRVEVWTTGEDPIVEQSAEVPGRITSLDWNDERDVLAVGTTEGRVHVWRGPLEESSRTYETHRNRVTRIHLQPNGDYLFSESWNGTVRVTDLAMRSQQIVVMRSKLRLPGGFSQSGDRIGFIHEHGFGYWRIAENPLTVLASDTSRKDATSVSFHPREPDLVVRATNAGIEFWDTRRRSRVGFLAEPNRQSMRISRDGNWLFAGGKSGLLRWTLNVSRDDRGKLVVGVGDKTPLWDQSCHRMDVSNDGEAIAVVGEDHVAVFNVRDGSVQCETGKHLGVRSVDFSHDSLWIATGTYRGVGVRIWDASSGKLTKELNTRWYGAGVAMSPTTDRLVMKTWREANAQFWSTDPWEPQGELALSTGSNQLSYSPDGRIVAAGFSDYIPQLVDSESAQILARLEAPQGERLIDVVFDSTGNRLAIAGDQNLHIWRLDVLRSRLAALQLNWSLHKDR